MSEKPTHIWVFDHNQRVYKKPAPGRLWSEEGPIWGEFWVKCEVTGETSRSWLTSRGYKVPKKNADKRFFLFSKQDVERATWKHDHQHKIIEKIEYGTGITTEQLDAVAAAIGYEPRMPQ